MDHYATARKVAAALAADETVDAICLERFARSLRVCMHDVGEGMEDGRLYPYAVVTLGESEGGVTAERETASVEIHLSMDASANALGGWTDTSKPQVASDGVYDWGGDSVLADLAEAVRDAAEANGHGANAFESAIAYDGMTAYPVQFAAVTVRYFGINVF